MGDLNIDRLIQEGKKRLFGDKGSSGQTETGSSENGSPIFDTTDLEALIAGARGLFKKKGNETQATGESKPKDKAERKTKDKGERKSKEKAETVEAREVAESEAGIHVCIDLGNDTVKVAYAYERNGEVKYGKILKDGLINTTALPSTAYYDERNGKWLYADEIESGEERSFTTVVKIKNLLSLLASSENSEVSLSNSDYYLNKNSFPKFYFPVSRRIGEDFALAESNDMTFIAEGYTPQSVCQGFFNYLKTVTEEKLAQIVKYREIETGKDLITSVSLVHPPTYSDEQIEELTYLVKTAFNMAPKKVMTTTR
ncbi:MAG: hypothetical protein IKC64_03710, partial [Clostridia bacterium]|nr:hypothetical protein [Clostridia bacterium]